MSLNSLTYPLRYEDARPITDLESTLHIDLTDDTLSSETGFEGVIGKRGRGRFDCPLAGRDRHRQRTYRARHS
jgi:hypothetical protein